MLGCDETRLRPSINGDASDFVCIVTSFSLETSNSVPVFIPEMDTTQANANKAIYKLAFVKITNDLGGPLATPVALPASMMREPSGEQPPHFPDKVHGPPNTHYHARRYQRFIT